MEKRIPNDIFFAEVERLVGEGSEVRLTVSGTSMRPFLRNGRDSVVVGPFSDGELIPGAIVLFRYRDGHLLHRIVAREGEMLEIQGDAVPSTEKAAVGDVVAVVKQVMKENGRAISNGSAKWDLIYRRHIRKQKTMKLLSRVKRAVIRG